MTENILLLILIGLLVFILFFRVLGAWIFRINEVIYLLKDIRELLGGEKHERRGVYKRKDKKEKEPVFDLDDFKNWML